MAGMANCFSRAYWNSLRTSSPTMTPVFRLRTSEAPIASCWAGVPAVKVWSCGLCWPWTRREGRAAGELAGRGGDVPCTYGKLRSEEGQGRETRGLLAAAQGGLGGDERGKYRRGVFQWQRWGLATVETIHRDMTLARCMPKSPTSGPAWEKTTQGARYQPLAGVFTHPGSEVVPRLCSCG